MNIKQMGCEASRFIASSLSDFNPISSVASSFSHSFHHHGHSAH